AGRDVFPSGLTTWGPLGRYLTDSDNPVSDLFLESTNSSHAMIIGHGLLLRYSGDADEFIGVVVSDGTLTGATTIHVRVALPAGAVRQVVPGWLAWMPLPAAAAAVAAVLVYRRRQLEWAFLVTKTGLLVS